MSGDPGIDAKITELTKLSIWSRARLLVAKPCPDYLLSVKSPALRELIERDELDKDLDANYDALFVEIFHIESSMHVKSGSYLSPFRKLPEYKLRTKSMPLSVMYPQIELGKVEDEFIEETKALLNSGVAESVERYFLSHNEVTVHYQRGGVAWGHHLYGAAAWEQHKRETLEKIQVLDVGKLWLRKFMEIFKQAITERESHKGETLEQIKRSQKVVETAEKLVPQIRDAERRCETSGFTDLKSAEKFVRGWQKLDALRTEFFTLRGSGIEFQDFAKPEPIFPDSSVLMFTETDIQRKARIFGIVQDKVS